MIFNVSFWVMAKEASRSIWVFVYVSLSGSSELLCINGTITVLNIYLHWYLNKSIIALDVWLCQKYYLGLPFLQLQKELVHPAVVADAISISKFSIISMSFIGKIYNCIISTHYNATVCFFQRNQGDVLPFQWSWRGQATDIER